MRDELGDILFVCANLARKLDLDPEDALRSTNAKFARRFHFIEAAAGGTRQDRPTSRTWRRWTRCGTRPRRRSRAGLTLPSPAHRDRLRGSWRDLGQALRGRRSDAFSALVGEQLLELAQGLRASRRHGQPHQPPSSSSIRSMTRPWR